MKNKATRVSFLSIGDYLGISGVQYFKQYTVSTSNISNAFTSNGYNTVSTDSKNVYFYGVPEGHQEGDTYFIRLDVGASSSNAASLPSNVDALYSPYKAKLTLPSYYQIGEQSSTYSLGDLFTAIDVVGMRIKFHMQEEGSDVKTWYEGATYVTDEIVYSDGHYYKCVNGGTAGGAQPIHTNGTRSDGKVSWLYLHSGTGSATITSVDSPSLMRARVDNCLPVFKWGQNSYRWDNFQWSQWGYKQKYPNNVFFWNNRLGYTMNTPGYGSYLQLSKSDNFEDFDVETFGEVLDSSGVNIIISGHKDNRINWVLPGNRLYMGSYAGEYNVQGAEGGVVSPTGIALLPVSSIGGANVDALKFEELNMFVGALGNELYAMKYDYTTDDFAPENIGFVNNMLLEDKITRLQPLKNIDRNVYFTTGTNKLRILNNSRESKKLGFYRVGLDGDVLDVASSSAGGRSLMFCLVKRGDVFTVEMVSSEKPTYMLATRERINVETDSGGNQVLVDLPSTLNDAELAGKDVYVVNGNDGQYVKTRVSDDGDITHPFHTPWLKYGICMNCEIHTTPPFGSKLEGQQQKSVRFLVRLLDSGAFSYGSSHDFDKWYDYNNWNVSGSQEWDEAHRLMTGDLQLPASFGYMQGQNTADGLYPNDTGVGLNLRSETPEPFNLLMVSSIYV